MDYKEFESGLREDNFWHKAKLNLIEILLNKVGKNNLKILNVGVGIGNDLKIINKFGDVTILDINRKVLDMIPKDLYKKKILGDVKNLNFSDGCFDLVLCLDVFEHIDDDYKAFSEIKRVLKKDGFLIFSIPAFNFIFSSYDLTLGHKRRYNKKLINNRLAGFKKIFFSYWNFFLFVPFVIERLIKKKIKHRSYKNTIPCFINNIFLKILIVENFLIKHNFRFPFGLTMCGIYRKL